VSTTSGLLFSPVSEDREKGVAYDSNHTFRVVAIQRVGLGGQKIYTQLDTSMAAVEVHFMKELYTYIKKYFFPKWKDIKYQTKVKREKKLEDISERWDAAPFKILNAPHLDVNKKISHEQKSSKSDLSSSNNKISYSGVIPHELRLSSGGDDIFSGVKVNITLKKINFESFRDLCQPLVKSLSDVCSLPTINYGVQNQNVYFLFLARHQFNKNKPCILTFGSIPGQQVFLFTNTLFECYDEYDEKACKKKKSLERLKKLTTQFQGNPTRCVVHGFTIDETNSHRNRNGRTNTEWNNEYFSFSDEEEKESSEDSEEESDSEDENKAHAAKELEKKKGEEKEKGKEKNENNQQMKMMEKLRRNAGNYVVFNYFSIKLDETTISYRHCPEFEDSRSHLFDFDDLTLNMAPITYHSISSSYKKLFEKIKWDLIKVIPSIAKTFLKKFLSKKKQ
jgi:hypothetical protein